MKFLILAGGKGTRLWPVSRKNKPKQFQKLISNRTMLQETVDRIQNDFPLKDIYIATNESYVSEIENELPKLPVDNIIGEPAFRERASCIALASAIFSNQGADEIMAVFPSDHYIKKEKELIRVLKKAEAFLNNNPDYLVAVGVKPTGPETGYGYIKHQKKTIVTEKSKNNLKFYKIEKFIEKPDLETAEKYYQENDFLWNAGIYLWKTSAIIDRFKKFIPDSYERLCKIRKVVGTSEFKKVLDKEYPLMDMTSVEYGIMENDHKSVVIEADLGWSDVGSWSVLKDSLIGKDSHFVKGEHLDIGSKNLLVYGCKKFITTVGLKDLIIVDTDDAILICDKNNSQLVKTVVEKLEKDGKVKLL
ncbi:MAG: mannose-1-phosphate guanylyltransferase [Candidatus Pacebacteria bacterium]|nr:mannose-1-phosphate guanylyltransferase [Candidatus Paceibacterota bacterium]